MNNFQNINQFIASLKKIANELEQLKEPKKIKIDDKFIIVHPKNNNLIDTILEENGIEIEKYSQEYCDTDKIYIVDKVNLFDMCDI